MSDATVSSRMVAVADEMRAVMAFGQRVLEGSGLGPDACDFMFGNPQEAPLRGLVEAIIRYAEPRDVHWFGYQKYDPSAREAAARSLSQAREQHFEPADIAITAGGFGAIAAALLAVIEVGDEVCYPRPGPTPARAMQVRVKPGFSPRRWPTIETRKQSPILADISDSPRSVIVRAYLTLIPSDAPARM